jgi:hypothetical protein
LFWLRATAVFGKPSWSSALPGNAKLQLGFRFTGNGNFGPDARDFGFVSIRSFVRQNR